MIFKIFAKQAAIFYSFYFPLIKYIAEKLDKLLRFLYQVLMFLDWNKKTHTEWMDHDQDYLYQTRSKGFWFPYERGSIARLYCSNLIGQKEKETLKPEKKLNILDLASGDSFISQNFFHDISKTIVSIDLDEYALKRGKDRIKNHKFMNKDHHFIKGDIEKHEIKEIINLNNLDMKFDFILFNAAIEHFKEKELKFIFDSIKRVLSVDGIISIYTIVEKNDGDAFHHHESFYESKEQLEDLLKIHFKYTKSYESLVEGRHNIYSVASNIKI
tara:strand:+ start:288 stop:1100 length:813 start_codon:yes stop_codon:yes gene_type:complete